MRLADRKADSLLGKDALSASRPFNGTPSIHLEAMTQLKSGELLMVDRRRRNGLILYKPFHAEFAGPGAAVGGSVDQDCYEILPVGDFSMTTPQSYQERQNAYLIRRQWIKLTQKVTDEPVSLRRAQMILEQFANYFDRSTIDQIPDEAFAQLVGVLPHTVRLARRPTKSRNLH